MVEWFNRIFPTILCEDSDLTNAIRYPGPAEASRPALDGTAVFIKGFAKADREGEARHLAECIRRELALPTPSGEKPSTMAVLVRSRTHLPELVEALRAAKIPYRAVKTDRLSDWPLVRDLDALRSALTNLADRTAWLAILRAPWCGLALADLLTYAMEMNAPRCGSFCGTAALSFLDMLARRWLVSFQRWKLHWRGAGALGCALS